MSPRTGNSECLNRANLSAVHCKFERCQGTTARDSTLPKRWCCKRVRRALDGQRQQRHAVRMGAGPPPLPGILWHAVPHAVALKAQCALAAWPPPSDDIRAAGRARCAAPSGRLWRADLPHLWPGLESWCAGRKVPAVGTALQSCRPAALVCVGPPLSSFTPSTLRACPPGLATAQRCGDC